MKLFGPKHAHRGTGFHVGLMPHRTNTLIVQMDCECGMTRQVLVYDDGWTLRSKWEAAVPGNTTMEVVTFR